MRPRSCSQSQLIMSSKSLYLDFDGVLHPNNVQKGQAFCHIAALDAAMQGSDASIVISSTWRFYESLENLRGFFPPSLRIKIQGLTGQAHVGSLARWHEISSHAAQHDVHDWRALDDAASQFPLECPNLILCNGQTGLQTEQLSELRRWLLST